MRKPFILGSAIVCALSLLPTPGQGDAVVWSRAMNASTIAEVFVEDGLVRAELAIGVRDLGAFRNLLPDGLYERLGHDPEPLAERYGRFFTQDWVLRADEGEPLVPRIEQLVGRRRVIRDEITGEPLPNQPEDAEPVVSARLVYPLAAQPATLSVKPPFGQGGFVAANVGFVVYHQGLPVNDFRYLGTEETLDLDWEDPWYSRFRNRNLRRQFDAPMSAFIYAEPFEVRSELIVRPKDMQQWIDLGLEGRDVIPVAEQEDIKRRVAEFLRESTAVTIDGRPVVMTIDRVNFVRRTLRRTGIIDPPEDLLAVSATLGVIMAHPTEGLPQEASLEWTLFSSRIQQISASAADEAGGLPYLLTPDDNVLVWQNFLKNPSLPAYVELEPPPQPERIVAPVASVACLLLLLGATATQVRDARRGSKVRARTWAAAAALLVLAVLAWPYARVGFANPLAGRPTVPDADAREVVAGLLGNVYRAFDYRDENDVYDVLARSASGDLLEQVYLEMRRGLELQNQGGARVKVKDVEMVEISTENLREDVGFKSRCTWKAVGSVWHWGHVHQRTNRYEALLTVRPVDGSWKITHLEILEEVRI